MIDLIDDSEIYVLNHPSGASFKMKHWTRGMQDEVDNRCLRTDGKGVFSFDVPLERELKIQHCLVDWDGINYKGEAMPCVSENKKRLPVGIFLWLIQQIDERCGIRMKEDEKKN